MRFLIYVDLRSVRAAHRHTHIHFRACIIRDDRLSAIVAYLYDLFSFGCAVSSFPNNRRDLPQYIDESAEDATTSFLNVTADTTGLYIAVNLLKVQHTVELISL